MATVVNKAGTYPLYNSVDRQYPTYPRSIRRPADIFFAQPYMTAAVRTVQEKLEEVVSAADFGATESSTTVDQYAALQKALDTGKSVMLDAFTYRISQPLRFRKACQQLIGKGRRTVGGTRIYTDAGVTQALICDSDVEGSTLYDCGLNNILFSRASYADGTAITLNKAHGFSVYNAIVQQFNRGVDSFGANNTRWDRLVITAKRAGGWCVRLKGTLADTGGIALFNNCTWDCADAGFGVTGLGQEADGLVLEGAVATVTTYSLQIVRARRALALVAGTEGTGVTANPYFIYNYDFQSDRTGECGVHMAAGNDVVFDRGWIQGGYNAHNGGEGSALYMAPGTSKLTYSGHIGGSAYHGVDIGGSQVVIRPSTIARNSAVYSFPGFSYTPTTNNTYDNVIVRPTASDVAIIGGAIGTNENGVGLARYGVTAQAGAQNVRLLGVSLLGNVSGPLNDQTGGEVQAVACTTATGTETVKARNNALTEIGNNNGIGLRVGSASGNIVNNLRIAGSAAGLSISLFAEGVDTNIGMLLATKGTGTGRLRQDTSDRLTWDATRIDALLPVRIPTYTVSGLPAAASYTRCMVYVSDGTGNKRFAISDGTNWRWPDGTVVS